MSSHRPSFIVVGSDSWLVWRIFKDFGVFSPTFRHNWPKLLYKVSMNLHLHQISFIIIFKLGLLVLLVRI